MRSKEAQLPDSIKELRRARAEAITRQIAQCAQHKQLGKAVNHYRRLVNHERLVPTSYTYASLVNAYVNSGDMFGAEEILKRMKAVPGMSPNVVVYTTMLKGHMLSGDVEKAEKLINEMPTRKPPIALDARAVNTFLRVCQRAGDAPSAWAAYRKIKGTIYAPEEKNEGWRGVTPDDATYKLVARLLSQALNVRDLRDVIKHSAHQASEETKKRLQSGGDATAAPCQFWNAGRCDRGRECVFFHDPAKTQRATVETADAVASMHVNLAHCAALLDDSEGATAAIATANDALDLAEALAVTLGEADASAENGGDEKAPTQTIDPNATTAATLTRDSVQTKTYKKTTRGELRLELKRVGGFLKRIRKGTQTKPDVATFLTRALVFDSLVEVGVETGTGGTVQSGSTQPSPEKEDSRKEVTGNARQVASVDNLVNTLHRRLCDAYGLERACEVSRAVSVDSARERLREILGKDGLVDFGVLFGHKGTRDGGGSGAVAEPKEKDDKKEKKEKKTKDVVPLESVDPEVM
mmetsp:Transcript_9841/g.36546  ORF Transcript_9841/g.36546 Transcript_9841/m.36546 type:complete len:524 (+) Transcript_9841:3798-5369(+)